jgi:hypothetical protein
MQHVKIFLPCNFEVNPITHFGIYFKIAGKKKLIKGSNHQTHFWKRTIQWLFHQNFVLIEQMVSDKKLQKNAACQDLPTLQFWSKSNYPFWSYCPFFIKFSTRTIQWLFHQNFVLIEQMVSDKKNYGNFP